MDTYQYKYGDRPLEGYTIQRAAGRGGFGEVYYATSDAGRQVALKVVQDHEEIELRGIHQCMNLKSPHLVTIFDVKHNGNNKPFIIMEYVSGPSLADMLKESPGGLGPQKAAFFLREIGKGLSFLHECGIVHRDVKPGNIFYENGYVKIGDYGLSKAIRATNASLTINVGTIHYMAPEIGTGRYDKSIDIYALGVLLYEMLTGQVPFSGDSRREVLMKHMTALPDLTNIEEPFARVIREALVKDPADRYQSVQEMVEDVFGTEHVRNSVSQFAPEGLSVMAEHIAKKMQQAQSHGHTETEAPSFGEHTGNLGSGLRAQPQQPSDGAQARSNSDFSKEVGKKAEFLAKKAEVLLRQLAKNPRIVGQILIRRVVPAVRHFVRRTALFVSSREIGQKTELFAKKAGVLGRRAVEKPMTVACTVALLVGLAVRGMVVRTVRFAVPTSHFLIAHGASATRRFIVCAARFVCLMTRVVALSPYSVILQMAGGIRWLLAFAACFVAVVTRAVLLALYLPVVRATAGIRRLAVLAESWAVVAAAVVSVTLVFAGYLGLTPVRQKGRSAMFVSSETEGSKGTVGSHEIVERSLELMESLLGEGQPIKMQVDITEPPDVVKEPVTSFPDEPPRVTAGTAEEAP